MKYALPSPVLSFMQIARKLEGGLLQHTQELQRRDAQLQELMVQLQERDVQMQEVLQQMSSVQDQNMQLSQVGAAWGAGKEMM